MEYTWNDIEQHIAACIQCPLGQTRQHGTWIYRKNCALTATYHPSAILRDPSKYEIVKEDFCEIARKQAELCTCR